MPVSGLLVSAWFRARLQVLLTLGLRRQAAGWCVRRLHEAPDDVHALATRALLHVDEGELPAAHACLQQLLRLRPQHAATWFNLGYVLEQQDMAEGAEAAFRRATDLAPRMDRAWYGLALSLIALKRWDEAERALHQTNALQPLSPFGWVQLARLHVQRCETDRARQVIAHLQGFEPRAAALLASETGLAPWAGPLTPEGGAR